MDIPSFKTEHWIRYKGRGWGAAVQCDKERDRTNPGFTEVLINDEKFRVIAVDRHMPLFPIREGEWIGLLVEEDK